MRTREEHINDLAISMIDEGGRKEASYRFAQETIEEAERRAEQRVRAEYSAEISSLRNGLSKCAGLTDGFASPNCSVYFLSEAVPEEVRLYIDRLKAEIARDSERLDWLAECCIHAYAPKQYQRGVGCGVCLVSHVPETDRNLRAAIDAAREVG
ncbi:hypothetical protein [Novacetimonas hansenii]|uniref:hypothetical protein n=1 Tax=Novacetimonas hansenii TaxID=436 RepID=UPI000A4DFC4C|nr:hypothetical protein [Novacetimonas hansenii]